MSFSQNVSFRRLTVILLDITMVLVAFVGAFALRFDFAFEPSVREMMLSTFAYVLASYFVAANTFSLYRGIYYFSSFADLVNITKATAAGGILSSVLILFLRRGYTGQGLFPRSVLILHPLLAFLGICAVRFTIRVMKNYLRTKKLTLGEARKVLLVGAGDLGESLLRQMLKTTDPHYSVVGFIDDDPAKWGMLIHGLPVLGGRGMLEDTLRRERVDEIVIAIANRRGEMVRSVMDVLYRLEEKPELKIAPGLDEMLKSPGQGFTVRQVKPADLLNRDVVKLDEARIARAFERKTVLVTGAGGTIGGELCRQALRYNPEKMVILESHATSLFYAEAELRERSRGTAVVAMLGDIRDQGLIDRIFKTHRPHVVLHAAAHKHVHQLEFNVQEGVSNNVLGTYYLATAAEKFGAEVCILVSTDKAVRPTSVMGATKRAAECVMRSFGGSGTRFAGVRFGNVLGSSGSVLPIFQEQIAKGGPITVTDPQATRYFMTVEEAVGLILQATSMARGGEIFVLKMGTPVRIIDMAKNLILLSGLEPGKDIEIRVTGLRQGEKLDEEWVEDPTIVGNSEHPDIMLLKQEPASRQHLQACVLELELASRAGDHAALLSKIRDIVPTFQPAAGHDLPPSQEQTRSL